MLALQLQFIYIRQENIQLYVRSELSIIRFSIAPPPPFFPSTSFELIFIYANHPEIISLLPTPEGCVPENNILVVILVYNIVEVQLRISNCKEFLIKHFLRIDDILPVITAIRNRYIKGRNNVFTVLDR